MSELVTIKRFDKNNKPLYNILFDEAIEQIQKYSGKKWTDYNAHDPGITILELLCYSLTELSYRANYKIEDLLHQEKGNAFITSNYEAHHIFQSNALTINDLKKLVLDNDAVKNVKIYKDTTTKDFTGIYNIDVELFNSIYSNKIKRKEALAQIKVLLHNNRNICEDFNEPVVREYEFLKLVAEIEVHKNVNANMVYERVLYETERFLSPDIKFYSLQEMLDKGLKASEIFSGPKLSNGFILDSELENFEIKSQIHISDLIHKLMQIDGVKYIKQIKFIDENKNDHSWRYTVQNNKAVHLDLKKSKISISNDNGLLLDQLAVDGNNIYSKSYQRSAAFKKRTFVAPVGKKIEVDHYYSFQNDFPQTFGVGQLGVAPNASPKRKALAKQLKAYLLVFDQLFANFFTQLHQLKELFSLNDITQSYFVKPLFSIPGIEYMYYPFIATCITENIQLNNAFEVKKRWKKYLEKECNVISDTLNEIIDSKATFVDRRNRVLDHLLARFGINFDDYLVKYRGNSEQSITQKTKVLKEMPQISTNRYKGINVLESSDWVSGFDHRIAKLLDIKNINWLSYAKNPQKIPLQVEHVDDINIDNLLNDGQRISIKAQHQNEAIKHLFKYGTKRENYFIDNPDLGTYTVELKNHKGGKIGDIGSFFESRDKANAFLETFINELNAIDHEFTGFSTIEHLNLRPSGNSESFAFAVHYKSTDIFKSALFFNEEQRTKTIDQTIKLLSSGSNYIIEQENDKQYKIHIEQSEKRILNGVFYYENIHDAQNDIDKYVWYFSNLNQENDALFIRYFTRFQHNLGITFNPFSFVTTAILPEWCSAFQNENIRTKTVNTLIHEAPAHVYMKIRWLKFSELELFTTLYKNLKSVSKQRPEYDILLDEYLQFVFEQQ